MKKVSISILISILIISIFTTVNAATANITVGASSDAVLKGKSFTVTVAGVADNNITGMQATLTYDSSKLEIESKSVGQNFTDASGSNSEIAILSSGSTVEKSGTLYNITFKVLDTATAGETTIAIKNATLALVDDTMTQTDVAVSDEDVTINIKEDDTTVGNEDNNSSNDSNNSGNTNVVYNNSSSNSNKNTNKTTTKLPQTGVESVSLIAIIALGAISIVSYVSYRKYNNI